MMTSTYPQIRLNGVVGTLQISDASGMSTDRYVQVCFIPYNAALTRLCGGMYISAEEWDSARRRVAVADAVDVTVPEHRLLDEEHHR